MNVAFVLQWDTKQPSWIAIFVFASFWHKVGASGAFLVLHTQKKTQLEFLPSKLKMECLHFPDKWLRLSDRLYVNLPLGFTISAKNLKKICPASLIRPTWYWAVVFLTVTLFFIIDYHRIPEEPPTQSLLFPAGRAMLCSPEKLKAVHTPIYLVNKIWISEM